MRFILRTMLRMVALGTGGYILRWMSALLGQYRLSIFEAIITVGWWTTLVLVVYYQEGDKCSPISSTESFEESVEPYSTTGLAFDQDMSMSRGRPKRWHRLVGILISVLVVAFAAILAVIVRRRSWGGD